MVRSHCGMVLESIEADVLHQFLQLRNLNNCACTKGIERIIGKVSVSKICANLARRVVGADAAKTHWTRGGAALQRSDGVFFAKHRAEDRSCPNANIRQKVLGPVAAMKEDTLVRIGCRSCCSSPRVRLACRWPVAEHTC